MTIPVRNGYRPHGGWVIDETGDADVNIIELLRSGAIKTTIEATVGDPVIIRAGGPLSMDAWQRPFWQDIRGASLRNGHPAPFPAELAERLVRMYSFAGDLVLDPFCGSGSTPVAACRAGRNSISSDIERKYVEDAVSRLRTEIAGEVPKGAYLRQLIYEKM